MSHHERAGLGSRLPVHLAAGIAGDVFADGMEGDVGVDDERRGIALEIADEACGGAGDHRGHRVHVQGVVVLPRCLTSQQSERVPADRAGWADRDDTNVA